MPELIQQVQKRMLISLSQIAKKLNIHLLSGMSTFL